MNKYLEKIAALSATRGEVASIFGLGAAAGAGVGGSVVKHYKDKKHKEDRMKAMQEGAALGALYYHTHPEAFAKKQAIKQESKP